jgi:hypothetical protein
METTRHHKHGALVLVALFLLALPATLQAQFIFTTNNGAITITGYSGTNSVIVIPSATNGSPVTSVGDGAFFNGQGIYSRLTSVTVPDSITNIGNEAFEQCGGLTNVAIGTNVINIGTNAFKFCIGLTNIVIPASVISIGDGAFLACSKLRAITVNTNNSVYTSVAGVLFDKSQLTLI